MFSVRATVHLRVEHSPMQLVFGRDAIFNINHIINWQEIKENKQKVINQIVTKRIEGESLTITKLVIRY